MPVFLHGLSLQFYRGIGPERQRMGPFKDFNFFIGPNNAGKSTVLSFIHDHIPFGQDNGFRDFSGNPLNEYRGAKTGEIAVEVSLMKVDIEARSLRLISTDQSQNREHFKIIIDNLFREKSIWFKAGMHGNSPTPTWIPDYDLKKIASVLPNFVWNELWMQISGKTGGNLNQNWIPEVLNRIISAQVIAFPKTKIVPAMRKIGPKGIQMSDFAGGGLIDRLAQIQSPDHDQQEDKDTFEKINTFLQYVTGNAKARIEVPHHREHVLVHMDNKVLPLESLGTGIHEVIMIAAFCTISEDQIVCIEEPEIHLHPVLQRKLIRYLKENTSNQYFIATHSAAFIDTPDASIFRVTNDGVQTRVESATLDKDKLSICRDLGYKASDILQANAVIWVEGPSDRIYINHWIKAVNADLIEGIQYSIMFYGGRLLSHLDAGWEAWEELINLRKINQNLAVVIDSDKAKKGEPLNKTKKRIQKELAGDGAIAWITKGREIENYVEHSVLQEAVNTVHPQLYGKPSSGGQYDHALYFVKAETRAAIYKGADKVRVARQVCKKDANLEVLDLKTQIKALVKMIKKANQ